jgi:lipoprotein-releasing system permease protein
MKLSVGDRFMVFFIQNDKPRPRKFYVSGIYNTGLTDFDNLYLVGDIQHVQRLNGWDKTAVGGFEINVQNFDQLEESEKAIFKNIPYAYKTTSIDQRFPDIFSWLELQDINVIIIVTLVILVSAINMTSALLILILDRTQMIGILKALGSDDWSIQKIFLYQAMFLISIGIFWGNLLGLGLGFLQLKYGLIKLPEATYYLTEVPINFELSHILALNIGTLVLCTIMLIIPTYIVTSISPVKAIRFN